MMKRTIRVGRMISMDMFQILQHDWVIATMTRDEARRVMDDIFQLLDEPLELRPPSPVSPKEPV